MLYIKDNRFVSTSSTNYLKAFLKNSNSFSNFCPKTENYSKELGVMNIDQIVVCYI